jgi:hypothetical protein
MSIEEQLHELAAKTNSNGEIDLLSSIIGMVSTIIQDGRIEDLNSILKFGFSEYYVEN